MEAKAVFLDKDGTLIKDVPYNVSADKIIISDDCISGLLKLQKNGYKLIVISNQSGLAHGYFSNDGLTEAFTVLRKLFCAKGININAIYYCPHHPKGTVKKYATSCNCRKPESDLLFKAANEFELNLTQCWMIGDILNDVEAGKRAGCKSILIDNGNETEWLSGEYRKPDYKCTNINQAANFILKKSLSKF